MSRMSDAHHEIMAATPETLEWLIAGTMRVAVIGTFGIVDRGTFVEVYETTDDQTDQRVAVVDSVSSALDFIHNRCRIGA